MLPLMIFTLKLSSWVTYYVATDDIYTQAELLGNLLCCHWWYLHFSWVNSQGIGKIFKCIYMVVWKKKLSLCTHRSICFITARLHTYKNITDTETVSKQRVNLLTNVKFRKKWFSFVQILPKKWKWNSCNIIKNIYCTW
jgi:hypothetical protein